MDDKEVKDHDAEGRLITAEFESFFVCGVYVPNAGKKLITLPKVRIFLHDSCQIFSWFKVSSSSNLAE